MTGQAAGESRRDRREELLADPEATFKDPELKQEFIDEQTRLMQRFDGLRERIDSGDINPDDIAMAVLKERVRLAELHRGKPTS